MCGYEDPKSNKNTVTELPLNTAAMQSVLKAG